MRIPRIDRVPKIPACVLALLLLAGCHTSQADPPPPTSQPTPPGDAFPVKRQYLAETFTVKTGQLPGDTANCILFRPDGQMWVGTDKGIGVYDHGRWQPPLLKDRNVFSLYDQGKAVFAGTWNGLWECSPDGAKQMYPGTVIGPVLDITAFHDELWIGQFASIVQVKEGKARILLSLPPHGILPKVSLHGLVADNDTLWVGARAWPSDYPAQTDGPVWRTKSNVGNPPLFQWKDQHWFTVAQPGGLTVDYTYPRLADENHGIWLDTSAGTMILKNGKCDPAFTKPPPLDAYAKKIFGPGKPELADMSEEAKELRKRFTRLGMVIPPEKEREMIADGTLEAGEPLPLGFTRYSSLSADDKVFYDTVVRKYLCNDSIDKWVRHPDGTLGILTHAHFYEVKNGQWSVAEFVDAQGQVGNPLGFTFLGDDPAITLLARGNDGAYWIGIREKGLVKLTRH